MTTLYSFTGGADGDGPEARLIQGSDGNFYGVTASGGETNGQIAGVVPVHGVRPSVLPGGGVRSGDGTVFKITPAGVLTTLYTFTGGVDGGSPGGGVAQGNDGNFYGTTETGGTGDGTVYQLTPAGALTTLHSFAGAADGGYPICDLILGGGGNFYGTTSGINSGGSNGTVFMITTAGVLTTLHNFSGGAGGQGPQAGLTLGRDGNFYGTTAGGGNDNGDGTVFQITPAGVLTTLCNFPGGAGGSSPASALIQGSDGNFYGASSFGGSGNGDGILYQVTISEVSPALQTSRVRNKTADLLTPTGVLSVFYSFSGADGQNPAAALILASDGNFYGTTAGGGSGTSEGTVFQITPAGVLTSLYSFNSVGNGSFPVAGLTEGSDGNFYGTTPEGGNVFGNGGVFEITPAGVLTGLYAFNGGAGGSNPEAGLTLGADGNFYGTTYSGGNANGDGTIFKITPAGALTTLYTFTGGTDGANPTGALVQGGDGSFYGATHLGSFFNVTAAGVLTAYDVFTSGSTGAYPNGVTLGGGGNFYGTTLDSNPGQGTVFELTPAGALTTLATFSGANGGHPKAGVTLGSDGNYYGTTQDGGNSGSYGTVFQITPAGALTALYLFTGGADGANPAAGLVQGSDGNFYGTTPYGGDSDGGGDGTVFQITPAGVLTTLYTFTGGADGSHPQAGLTLGSDGNLYGTASDGGANGLGDVFRLILVAPVVTSGTESAQLGSAFSFQIVATNDPTSFGASGLPPGLTIDASTGIISGAPTQSGTFPVGLTATNSIGTGSGTLTLTVSAAPVQAPAVTGGTASAQVGSAFSYQIVATNNPTSFGATNLPAGLTVDAAMGIISGTPTVSGTFSVGISATNAGGTGTSALTLTVAPVALPVVTLAATVPEVVLGSGDAGKFTLSIPAPLSADLLIKYSIKGTAINGIDYVLLKAKKTIKAGKTSKNINIIPQGDLGGASKKVVTLVLKPETGYTVGTTGKVKVKILSAP